MNDAIEEIFGTKLSYSLSTTCKRMEIAEEEIRAALERHPAKATLIDRIGFGILVPPRALDGLSDEVYRRHARELMDRLAAGADTREATAAELLGILSAISFVAPLDSVGGAVFARTFAAVFPERADLTDGIANADHWLMDELGGSLRRKMAKQNAMRRPA